MPRPHETTPATAGARGAAVVLRPGEGSCIRVLGAVATLKAGIEDPAAPFSLVEIEIPAGGGVRPHLHAEKDEVLYVLEGSYALQLGDETFALVAGGCAVVPRGTVHGFRNVGGAGGRLLVVSSPPAPREQLFVELASSVALGAGAERELREAFARVASRRGVALPGAASGPDGAT